MDYEECFDRGDQYLIDRKYPEAILSYKEGWDALKNDEEYSDWTRKELYYYHSEKAGYQATALFLFANHFAQ